MFSIKILIWQLHVTVLLVPDITAVVQGIQVGKIKKGARNAEVDLVREENGQRPIKADLGTEK